MKVMMVPHADTVKSHGASGIQTLILKYFEHLPEFGIELVDSKADSFDVLAVHAGMTNQYPLGVPTVSHIHGLYWTADYQMAGWAGKANRSVINSLRSASLVTAPSDWVAQTVRRDMRINSIVLRHGIDYKEWENDFGSHGGYVLWNKNRSVDVCSPRPVHELAKARPEMRFLTTFADGNTTPNIKTTGLVPHTEMRKYIQNAQVYLATTKETFGIGTLEAMASGVPVLGFNHGGTAQIVEHSVTGYLAQPGDFDDLAKGLDYCIRYRDALGDNALHAVRKYDWGEVAQFLAEDVYKRALTEFHADHGVSVVIPCYNKEKTLERAVMSVLNQTLAPKEIIIVDNNSKDSSASIAKDLAKLPGVTFTTCVQQGVACARNHGMSMSTGKYICCLDADDEIAPEFLETCYKVLEQDQTIGLAYTKIEAVAPDGRRTVSAWPGHYNFDNFLKGKNQVPTCNVFRKELFNRLGGYRQRYAPHGAGAEDAEFWLRMGAYGYRAELVSERPLFIYHLGGAVSGNRSYREANWRAWHPWTHDGKHPFASVASAHDGLAHPVRQYDRPTVAVVIPCAEAHIPHLWDALDSLDAQTYRLWEGIVVYDCKASDERLERAFPHIKFLHTDGEKGPGVARNIGAAAAIAPSLVFLDADDWLMPEALDVFIRTYQENPDTIIYSDYLAHSFIDNRTEIQKIEMRGRLRSYDPITAEAVVYHRSSEYNCQRAQAQPDPGNMYIWNLITCLVPTKYHKGIGGFDENMKSWEDWDYWLRMSHRGWCFTQVTSPLVEYRFYTGSRRSKANPDESGESGRQLGQELIQYLRNKYEGTEKIMCGGCKGRRSNPPQAPAVMQAQSLNAGAVDMNSSDMVWVVLSDGNIGGHPITFGGTNYGYRADGDKFLMQSAHARLDRRVRMIEPDMADPEIPSDPLPEATAPPQYADWQDDEEEVEQEELVEVLPPNVEIEPGDDEGIIEVESYDLTQIWGVDDERSTQLKQMGIRTPQSLAGMGYENLVKVLGVTDLVAKRMINSASKL